MSLQKRISQLEQHRSAALRWIIARQDYLDANLFHVSENGHDAIEVMTEDELTDFEATQGDNVKLIKVVYEDTLNN